MFGQDGNDVLLGREGPDLLRGRSGDDIVRGGQGRDHLFAGVGVDTVFGGPDDDVIYALAQADAALPGGDTVFGGRGHDAIHVNDGESDNVDCGRDRDIAIVDLGDLDHVSHCEVVIQRAPNPLDDQQETGS